MSTPTETHPVEPPLAPASPGPPSGRDVALDYARRMFERQRVPLPPLGYRVDWADQPSRHKLYLDTVKLALPAPFEPMPDVGVGAAAEAAGAEPVHTMPGLGVLASVLGSYGLVDRRTEPNWNEDSRRKLRSDGAVWARPTASGGGMYPAESYVVAGPDAPLPTGVYHYDTAHHGLDRLTVADRGHDLAAACGVAADLYLVATLRFWKNAFKYNSFCYHVVTQDVGALLGSWRLVLGAHDVPAEPVLWFDDAAVAAALDVDGHAEAPFVVLPLGKRGPRGPGGPPDTRPPRPSGTAGPLRPRPAGVEHHRVWERSARPRTFDLVDQVHAAALVGDEPRPAPTPSSAAPSVAAPAEEDGDVVELPPSHAAAGDLDLRTSLLRRRSSFGQLAPRPPLTLDDLGWVLSAVDQTARSGTDVAPAPRDPWTRLWVLAGAVDGLEQRAYAYTGHRLVGGPRADVGALQRHYALTNYNLGEVAAVLVVTGRLGPLVEAYGARGYRMLGIEVGQAAQSTYLAATARGLGVGAVLGIDNLAVDELLGIGDTDERSMLFLLLGHDRVGRAGYDHALRPAVPDEGTPR
ncbi:SagB-type dehydrogenase family enzyme [Haloactinopolyspora alba]|uniref:SagB-type dehydrogenase family enzyme n=1 Tax=Haloactinopolyspora alba TaxID=648780 RepID=A0A2P8DWM6_9ACTN|nr:nitroreductase family protein [Haloactinopolyspora alba]PSL01623.1 SagB-type dehydrogenase family enzyme [Haloactinopolyspora alba]